MDNYFDNYPISESSSISTRKSVAVGAKASTRRHSKRRVALLGAGYIADWHAKALALIDSVELVAVCDQDRTRAAALADKFNVPRVYRALAPMLADEHLDAVHVLLPPDAHFGATKEILDAGVDAFVEKPMSLDPADCETLTRLAKERHLRLGVGHNFLFSECYERLRHDLKDGILGVIDHVAITWHRELAQVTSGPFDIWMLRDPRNIMLEVGPHCVAEMLDLVGAPDTIEAQAGNAIDLPSGQKFFRRWNVNAVKGRTAIDLRFSFVPGFDEYSIHVRGSLASATVDFERNTYALHRHHALSDDFDRYAVVRDAAKSSSRQARATLTNYVLSKLHLRRNGTPYGASIAAALRAFYENRGAELDARIGGHLGGDVIRICQEIGQQGAQVVATPTVPVTSGLPSAQSLNGSAPSLNGATQPARILILGATGFIGRELTRQLIDSGHRVRILARSPGKLPAELRAAKVECVRGDLNDGVALREAMNGIECVYHLARANVKTWPEFERYEIDATRVIAEAALGAGVKRFIYTGTIDSYYAGAGAGTITEETPFDENIEQRNLYARAKAASEQLLRRLHAERGLPLIIVRPGIVIGRGGSPMHWGVGMWWYKSVCQTWGEGRNPLPLVLVEDVANGLIAASAAPGIEGESFNLVGDLCLSARDYLDEMDRCGAMRIQRHATPIASFYLTDMVKWVVKVATRHPDRRMPSYRDWESRRQLATFDCTRAKTRLNWTPTSDRAQLVRKGIHEPMKELLG